MKNVQLATIFGLLFIINQNVYSCGEYKIAAKVILREGTPSMVVFPNSKSEITLRPIHLESFKLAPYINRYIKADLQILKMNDGTRYQVKKISHIDPIIPQFFSGKDDTFLNQIKSSKCD